MRIHVLGSAAGGGLPQWNCGCPNCEGARRGAPWIRRRTQSSIAVSADGERWALINASPDIRSQLADSTGLRPAVGRRGTRIGAVVLVDAQIDHSAGLLVLREGDRLALHATSQVHDELATAFPVSAMLEHYCGVERHEIPTDGSAFALDGMADLAWTAVPLPGKPPPYSRHRAHPRAGDNIGLAITDTRTGRSAFYAPGLGGVDGALERQLAASDCVLLDGTFWTEDEMMRTQAGSRTATDMGHLPLAGEHGLLRILERLDRPAKYLIHLNNTNPVLDERSPERTAVAEAGIAVTHDGMDIEV